MLKKLLAALALSHAALSFAAVDVNSASAADLTTIKGVGPSMSSQIVEERKKGAFKNWDDFIARVKGVGEKNAAKFSSEGMTVNGAALGAAAPAKPAAKPAAKTAAKP